MSNHNEAAICAHFQEARGEDTGSFRREFWMLVKTPKKSQVSFTQQLLPPLLFCCLYWNTLGKKKKKGDAPALPCGMLMERLLCSFVCLCPWKNPSAIKTLELYRVILFHAKWKTGIDIYCAHHSPVFSPRKDLSSTARETIWQQTAVDVTDICGRKWFCEIAENFMNLGKCPKTCNCKWNA